MLASLLALSLTAVSAAVAAPFAYVSNYNSATVSVIDVGATAVCQVAGDAPPCVIATISVGNLPSGVAVNSAGTRAYVANKDDGTVSVIDVGTRRTMGLPVRVGQEPWAVAVTADGRRGYVALGNGSVVVLDIDANGGIAGVSLPITGVGATLNGIAIVGSRAYVTDSSAGNVAVIDGSSVTWISLGLNSGPNGIVASPSGDRIYVVHLVQDQTRRIHLVVSAIDTTSNAPAETMMIEMDTNAAPGGLAVSPDGTQLYVTNDGLPDRLHIVNIQSKVVTDVNNIGVMPVGVATNPLTGTHVFVGSLGGSVSVLGTTSVACAGQTPPCVIRSIPLGSATFVSGAFATDGPQYELTLTTVGAGSITAQPAPVRGKYAAGTDVALTATEASGSQFSGWSGACSGSGACNVTMNADTSVTATFTATPVPPPPTPEPPSCDAKVGELEKQVSKLGGRHGPAWLKAALYARAAAEHELSLAKKKVGENDSRYRRAMKEFKNGDAALCAGRYWRAKHEFWDAFDKAHRILRYHRHYRR